MNELKQRAESVIKRLDALFQQSESILKEFHPTDVVETYSSYDTNGKFLKEIQQLLKELAEREGKLAEALKQMLSLNVLHAPKSDADNYIIDSVVNTLSELGVK